AAVRRERLRTRVARAVAPERVGSLVDFLAELVGATTDESESAELRAARLDPMRMGEQLRAACAELLGASCDRDAAIVVVDNLQWADVPSVRALDFAMRVLRDRPLFVLATARPEVHEVHAKVWADRDVQEVRLGGLGARAAERLARGVLGEGVSGALVARIV